MKIEFELDSSFAYIPGLSKPFIIDTDALPEPKEKEALEGLVQAAHFFDAPPTIVSSLPGQRDGQQYTITIENEGRSHTVLVCEPAKDAPFQKLVDYLKAKQAASRRPA